MAGSIRASLPQTGQRLGSPSGVREETTIKVALPATVGISGGGGGRQRRWNTENRDGGPGPLEPLFRRRLSAAGRLPNGGTYFDSSNALPSILGLRLNAGYVSVNRPTKTPVGLKKTRFNGSPVSASIQSVTSASPFPPLPKW